MLVERFKNKLK
jgi:Ca2+-binding EF-hand superfamily protein